jgi:signal recognition particle GTPase
MTNILHVTSSIRADDSVSTSLGSKLIKRLAIKDEATVVTRDLAKNDLPFIDAERHAANLAPYADRSDAQHGLAKIADELIDELEAAGATVVRGAEGADPSSVVFDAVEHAAAMGADLVLADTAGRVHTRRNLMDELAKVRRVAGKGAGTVTETLLVLDATTGQNGLVQARQFGEAADVTGLILTKMDGSARGGIVLAVEHELGIPVKFVGVGEGLDDLVPFEPGEFVDALFE